MGVTEVIGARVVEVAAGMLPAERHGWACGMRAEYHEACDAGQPMRFALGCLSAALRTLLNAPAGRFALVRNGTVLATLVPLATFHLGCAVGASRFALGRPDHFHTALLAGTEAQRRVAAAYAGAAPLIAILLFALATSHLVAAWQLMEWRLRRALVAGGAGLLAATGLAVAIVGSMGDWRGVAVQFAGAGVEIVLLSSFAFWAKRLKSWDHHATSGKLRT